MKRLMCALMAGVLVLSAGPALALYEFDPPWVANPNDPQWAGGVTTSQGWEYAPGGPSLLNPSHVNNPFGPPQMQNPGTMAHPETVLDFPGHPGEEIWTWHIDQDGGYLDFLVWNNPEPRNWKVIHLQYTSDKAGTPVTSPVGSASPGGVVGYPGSAWYTYEWLLTIQPNPECEYIRILFPESANIEEVHINTICVPEPASLAMLGAGGLVAVMRLRRARAASAMRG